jgi:8-oxo-dGTP diphosphatase
MDQKQLTIVVGLVANERGEILLAKRHQPDNLQIHNKWEFPGGGIDFGETPEEAILREVKEETGLEVKIVRLLPKAYSSVWDWPEGKVQVIILSYECKKVSGELDSTDPEIGELKYFKPEDAPYKESLPKTKEIIELLKPKM